MSGTTSPDARKPRLSAADERATAEYRPVCSTAVAGLVLGLLSPLALAGPVLWVLPWAGAAVSLAALGRIEREQPAPLGRRAAVVGLFLSVLLAVAAPTDHFVHAWLVAG